MGPGTATAERELSVPPGPTGSGCGPRGNTTTGLEAPATDRVLLSPVHTPGLCQLPRTDPSSHQWPQR